VDIPGSAGFQPAGVWGGSPRVIGAVAERTESRLDVHVRHLDAPARERPARRRAGVGLGILSVNVGGRVFDALLFVLGINCLGIAVVCGRFVVCGGPHCGDRELPATRRLRLAAMWIGGVDAITGVFLILSVAWWWGHTIAFSAVD